MPARQDVQPSAMGDPSRILTVPNVLSVIRLASIPLFLWLLFGRDDRAAAAYLLAGLGATDWIDGYVARRFDQVSTLGKVLDPTADRLLLGVGVVAILVDGAVPLWVGWAALIREGIVAVGALIVAALGGRRIDVTSLGKAGTFGLMFTFPLFLVSESAVSWADAARAAAWIAAIPALVLSYAAAALYVPLARTAVREGRVGSSV